MIYINMIDLKQRVSFQVVRNFLSQQKYFKLLSSRICGTFCCSRNIIETLEVPLNFLNSWGIDVYCLKLIYLSWDIRLFAKFNILATRSGFCDGWLDFTQTINCYLCLSMFVACMQALPTWHVFACLCLCMCGCLNYCII